jgi:hypothetical protein
MEFDRFLRMFDGASIFTDSLIAVGKFHSVEIPIRVEPDDSSSPRLHLVAARRRAPGC